MCPSVTENQGEVSWFRGEHPLVTVTPPEAGYTHMLQHASQTKATSSRRRCVAIFMKPDSFLKTGQSGARVFLFPLKLM